MSATPEQIEAKAMEIGSRPYHPLPPNFYHPEQHLIYPTPGISIRQELMRTAMGATDLQVCNQWAECVASIASELANAILLQMAKDELGV